MNKKPLNMRCYKIFKSNLIINAMKIKEGNMTRRNKRNNFNKNQIMTMTMTIRLNNLIIRVIMIVKMRASLLMGNLLVNSLYS